MNPKFLSGSILPTRLHSGYEMERAFYFTVFVGRRPGVYTLWTEFEAQIKGFEGYRYDIYLTEAAAIRAFNRYCMKKGSVAPIELEQTRYFVVFDGHTPGVYSTWRKAEKAMCDYPATRYGVFRTRMEAYNVFQAHKATAKTRLPTEQEFGPGTETSMSSSLPQASFETVVGAGESMQTTHGGDNNAVGNDIDDSIFEKLFDVMEEHNYFKY